MLLVEDSPSDIELTLEAFKRIRTPNQIFVVEDGEEALLFLNKVGRYKDIVTPDLILLDLNLPKVDGQSVLKEIKSNDAFRHIPVIILSTSTLEEDILQAYKLYASCYIVKPLGIKEFWEMIDCIELFWFKIARLPS